MSRSLKLGAMVRATPERAAAVIREALSAHPGGGHGVGPLHLDVQAAAHVLGLHRVTLWRYCVALGLELSGKRTSGGGPGRRREAA